MRRGKGQSTKEICVVWHNPVPTDGVVWLEDATANLSQVVNIVGCSVADATPAGTLIAERPIIQIPQDISRQKSSDAVRAILRGILAAHPTCQDVGVITHRNHVQAVQTLGPPFADRIVDVAHFGSGRDRASNDWFWKCDLIVVAGTPRVPASAVIERLFQLGELQAVPRDGDWGPIEWIGQTESGNSRIVKASGYRDEAWRKAHQSLVRAALIQAAGRGRGLQTDGCDVIVLSNEDCGFLLSDTESIQPITAKELQAIEALSDIYAKKNTLGTMSVSSAELAAALNVSERQARRLLSRLNSFGMAQPVGERGGWLPAASLSASPVEELPF